MSISILISGTLLTLFFGFVGKLIWEAEHNRVERNRGISDALVFAGSGIGYRSVQNGIKRARRDAIHAGLFSLYFYNGLWQNELNLEKTIKKVGDRSARELSLFF